jgi:hypothetical protein
MTAERPVAHFLRALDHVTLVDAIRASSVLLILDER